MAKSSKSAKSERQKVIDDIRRKQKSAEKRQGMWIVGVCVLVALGIVLLAAWQPMNEAIRKASLSGKSLSDIGAGADVCEPVQKKPVESSEHVQPAQVQYTTAPPATGDHWNQEGSPAPIGQRFYTESNRPELESLVHNIEHGFNLLWYDATIADDSGAMAEIQKMADLMDVNDTNGRYKFKAVPWTADDAAEVEKAQQAAVDAAEKSLDEAEAALAKAKKKAEKKAAKQGVTAAKKKLAEAEKAAEAGGDFPKGQHIAFTHWTADAVGITQYCSEPSGEALQEFMYDYPYSDSPEPDIF